MAKNGKTIQPCGWDEKLKTVVHRFNMAERTCRCQTITVTEKVTHGGWRQIQKSAEAQTSE